MKNLASFILGVLATVVVIGIVFLAFPEFFKSVADKAYETRFSSFLKEECEDVNPTEEKPAPAETSLTEAIAPVVVSEETDKKPSLENSSLKGELDGKTLKITFLCFAESWPQYEGGNFFFANKGEIESFRGEMLASGYTAESIDQVIGNRMITQFLSKEAPEVKSFEIKGAVLTIKFKTTPKEDFEFCTLSAETNPIGDFGWEGLHFSVEQE